MGLWSRFVGWLDFIVEEEADLDATELIQGYRFRNGIQQEWVENEWMDTDLVRPTM